VAQRKIQAEDQIKTRERRTKRAAVAERRVKKVDYYFQKSIALAKSIGIVSETKKIL